MYPTITIIFGNFPRAPGRMSFLLKCASAKPRGFSLPFSLYIFFQQSQACAGFIPESQLKSKISHSLIHMGFIGLVTWLGVRELCKKRSKRLKECLRVILSKNLQSLACCRNMPSLRACEARLTGALSKGGKMRGVTTNVYLWKTSEKPKETGQNENSKFGSCIYV